MIPKMHYGVIVDVDERGTKVPNADMKKIFNHPWEDQLQKQKTIRSKRRCGLNIVWDDESEKEKDEGMEF